MKSYDPYTNISLTAVQTTGDPVCSDSTASQQFVADGLLPLLWPLTVFTRIALEPLLVPPHVIATNDDMLGQPDEAPPAQLAPAGTNLFIIR